jgi:predicted aspartyl protease
LSRANRISGSFTSGRVLVVPVELDGVLLRFIVDTGAAYCAIARKALDKIVAEPTSVTRSIAPIGKEVVEAPTLRIDTFLVGGVIQKNMIVPIVDFPKDIQSDGLLGMDFMGKYRITIEPDTQTLVLRQIPKKK